jgi:UDP-N-acetylmuramoyl-tripeptide--D-alanyl-D-alanine ligase
MIEELKKALYFPIASYFKFFAAIRLRRWHPKIVVVTGSSGKTTLLHLLESQIGDKAKYSHHANSSYGIPFDVLDFHRKSFQSSEWFELILKAPFAAFKNPPKEKIYIVEADCDRPDEGKFLASFLKPDIVLWLNVFRTHSMNFDSLVAQKKFGTVDEAIAYAYGFFLEYCKSLAIINGDLPLAKKQEKRTRAKVVEVSKEKYLKKYNVEKGKTTFTMEDHEYSFAAMLPLEMFYSIAMCKEAVENLDLHFDKTFSEFELPPGRSSLFHGIKNTTLIDSSYNGNLSSAKAILGMFAKFPAKSKWVVIGDMLELGEMEQEEHEKLAEILSNIDLEKIILFGSRTEKYTARKLLALHFSEKRLLAFRSLKDLDSYLHDRIKGGEAILFKGSQSMLLEGIIENLLKNKEDSRKLPRREQIWIDRRAKKLS